MNGMIEPTCPFGYTKSDINKILPPEYVFKFCTTVGHLTCNGRATKDDRKSKLQHYVTVCADDPHGWIWSRADILQFMEDEGIDV